KDEIKNCIDLTKYVFETFDMKVDIRLSFRDEKVEKYGGDSEYWERAQREIKEVADELELDYVIAPGEASFYGPKIDFIIKDALGRKWQVGTIQVDYVMPERFDLTFVGSDNQKHRPVIIHRAPFGSMERFTSILIEHFAGDFPVWLSPVQVMIIPVSDQFVELADSYEQELKEIDVRVEVDRRNDQIGAKIRDAEKRKIPYMLIIGEREANSGTVSVRRHRHGDQGSLNFSDFLSKVGTEINSRENPPNLNK
ncbi:MAG TPA: threonine--tRNA ligase, partial [Bacteroidetes bacterium]|nr:threonine--tRNA ligase [Bacteroidota bacterium]